MKTGALLLGLVLLISPLVAPCSVQAQSLEEVDLEIVLLADASGSIDNGEILFQREGYAAALTHPSVLKVIGDGILGKIAVVYVEWGDADSQAIVAGWSIIDGPDSANAFAATLRTTPRLAFGRNAIGSALEVARGLIETNSYEGLRKVIDFSADSANSWSGIPIEPARQAALSQGITINGLAILCRLSNCGGRPAAYDLEQAFKDTIVGGPRHFVVTVEDRDNFASAVRQKLILEIAMQ